LATAYYLRDDGDFNGIPLAHIQAVKQHYFGLGASCHWRIERSGPPSLSSAEGQLQRYTGRLPRRYAAYSVSQLNIAVGPLVGVIRKFKAFASAWPWLKVPSPTAALQ
jgi:hypothetical protein